MGSFTITANYVDIPREEIFPATITISKKTIAAVQRKDGGVDSALPFILPGFIDAHVHVESSMLVPSEFARLASVHGTVATVSDPHEIANVLGIAGIDFMIENGRQVPFKFFFGAPSCVPATPFETAGAAINAEDIATLLKRDDLYYLSEMMNFPGVLNKAEEVTKKINVALSLGKPVDGHAPGLKGDEARAYAEAGYPGAVTISTDHECFSREEALDKLRCGMKIIIREGSAARNFDALIDLMKEYPDRMMFCSDDKHPDSLEAGHINQLVTRALRHGVPLFHVLKAACINPIVHYDLPVGLLRKGDFADFIVVDNLNDLNIVATYINGTMVAESGRTTIASKPVQLINNFNCRPKKPADFRLKDTRPGSQIKVIEALNGQLITRVFHATVPVRAEIPDVRNDILKIAVVNRYAPAPPAIAYIKNFGLRRGAIASSVAHDSHNIIAVGTSDETICQAVNLLIAEKGGICAVDPSGEKVLPLPVAGLMSDCDGYLVANRYKELDHQAKAMGSVLDAPFMTLSFMALLVIPHLKLSDKGLFDGDKFAFTSLAHAYK